MTRFGSCSTGLLGLGRWKLRISSWKVTVDKASHSKFSLLYPHPYICIACLDTEVADHPLLNCLDFFLSLFFLVVVEKTKLCTTVFFLSPECIWPIIHKTAKVKFPSVACQLWFLAFYIAVFLQSVWCKFICFSIAILTLCLFLSLRSWARCSRVAKFPEECSRGDGGTASTSLMPGVGGIRLGRVRLEMVMLPVDSLPGLSLILRVMHFSKLCNYKQVRMGRIFFL